MGNIFQLLVLTTIGVLLLWFGYTLFVGFGVGRSATGRNGKKIESGQAGAPKTCPVCAARLPNGERVRSSAFPSVDGKDRLMHIYGCPYCLDLDSPRKRVCPVCGRKLEKNQYLVARMFEKPARSHVHVLGCMTCRGPRSAR
jgi:predicted nucleic acid-binding Zn ribbon protein